MVWEVVSLHERDPTTVVIEPQFSAALEELASFTSNGSLQFPPITGVLWRHREDALKCLLFSRVGK